MKKSFSRYIALVLIFSFVLAMPRVVSLILLHRVQARMFSADLSQIRTWALGAAKNRDAIGYDVAVIPSEEWPHSIKELSPEQVTLDRGRVGITFFEFFRFRWTAVVLPAGSKGVIKEKDILWIDENAYVFSN